MTQSIADILADAARLGITLEAHAGKVRFSPRSAMTPDLAQRITTRRAELLAALDDPPADTTQAVDATTCPGEAESWVSSVVSVSERGSCGAVAAPSAPRPRRFHAFRRPWAPSLPRLRVGEAVWTARRAGDRARARAVLSVWHEAMLEAVGRGLPRAAAELVAGGRVLDLMEQKVLPKGGATPRPHREQSRGK
ncbi:MAG: hypothetical protein IT429_25505 [Gemmataceae bacterium]|nr:hypothetical protein [Gemmataceae bacterium]